jgi:hypothetical protein
MPSTIRSATVSNVARMARAAAPREPSLVRC